MENPSQTDEERAVDDLDRSWNNAYERNDRTPLQRILADEFVAILADARSITKKQLMQPGPVPRNVRFSERWLRVYGATAITRGRLSLEHDGGTVDQRFTRVYTKQRDRWQAVAVQVYPIADAARKL
jgi:ketosteroid isomerase-like protein